MLPKTGKAFLIGFFLNLRAEVETEGAAESGSSDDVVSSNSDYFKTFTQLDEGAPEKEEIEKPVVKPDPKQGDPKQGGENTIPQGFEARFFDVQEGKEPNFKAQEALDFIFPNKEAEHNFRFSPIPTITEDEAKTRGPLEPAQKGIKDRILEQHKHFQEVEEKLMLPVTALNKAIEAGYSVEQAVAFAQQETRKYLAEYQANKKAEFEAEYYEQLEKGGNGKRASQDMLRQASINESRLHTAFGGKEAFDSVFFGTTDPKTGKQVPGPCTEDVWMMFKLTNPDLSEKKLTSKEIGQELEKWWPKFASNWENLTFLTKVARASIFDRTKPHMIDAIRNRKVDFDAKRREGKQTVPSMKATPRKTAEDNPLHQFMNPGERVIPSI